MVWRNHQYFTTLWGTLYLCSTPKGENEDLLLIVVLKMHQTATQNGCHRDAGHQGHDHTLSLLQECFWWPGMAKQMRQVIKACKCCLQYEGGTPKAPLCPIVATAALDLLHVDFTSIETTMELNQLPKVVNILVFQDHFTKHVLPYVTPDQTVKTITKFLYGGYISIFGAPARLLSDRGTCFTRSIIEELCKIPRHPMTTDYALPPPDEWAGREIAPDDYVHDWEAGRRQESWLAIPFGWNSACLQFYPIHSYWV